MVVAVAPPPSLPCPLEAGWEIVAASRLPRQDPSGQPAGGYSAAAYLPEGDQLWLLSDTPQGRLSLWRGLRDLRSGAPLPISSLPLAGWEGGGLPTAMDGEGLVLEGEMAWVASEGRRSQERPAQLLRFDRRTGRLNLAQTLPDAWQPAPGRGLVANQGPESLTLLRRSGQPDVLLLAAESALLQDPPGQARLLAWPLSGSKPHRTPSRPMELMSLRLPDGEGWGLTDLLAVQDPAGTSSLLGLLRRFQPPEHWSIRLALYPIPPPASLQPGQGAAVEPLASWDLLASGLAADNWEGITAGAELADGRRSLLLVSDDNFNPRQDNHLAQLAARRLASCPGPVPPAPRP